ncbi:MAG: hypothetical protein QXG00_06495 [Candidatus Woesearchaeota archaeon]
MGFDVETGDDFFDRSPPMPTQNLQEIKRQEKLREIAKQISESLSDLDRRIKVLEDRYINLRKKSQLTDQNIIESEKAITKEIKILQDSIISLRSTVSDVSEKLSLFNSEFENVARKTDLSVLQKYMDLWQPMNFVTRQELKQILEDWKKRKKK